MFLDLILVPWQQHLNKNPYTFQRETTVERSGLFPYVNISTDWSTSSSVG